jgi:hypothetical protein
MENNNLSTVSDRHTVTILLTITAPPSAIIGKSPSIGIGNHQYRSLA